MKVYFNYPDGGENEEATADPFEDARLRVFSNCDQCRKWLLNRAKQVKHKIMTQLKEANLIETVCKTWREVVL